MSKIIPTAEEFLKEYKESKLQQLRDNVGKIKSPEEALIEFAKLHVEAALEARDNLYETYYAEELKFTDSNKEFIRKSYPLTNIK